ncbi:MAG: hypothetical protein C4523_12650 [Myxococcales bacterium]|nr:MAG: hypothetical protein C4523_12650 [Myxococcales bacterium]
MSRALDDLCPHFRPLVFEFLARLTEAGIAVMIVDTLRSEQEHAANLAKGASWIQRSKHLPQPHCCNKSHALDVCPYEVYNIAGPDKLNWDHKTPVWGRIILMGENLGLRSGKHFPKPDLGHFEFMPQTVGVGIAEE